MCSLTENPCSLSLSLRATSYNWYSYEILEQRGWGCNKMRAKPKALPLQYLWNRGEGSQIKKPQAPSRALLSFVCSRINRPWRSLWMLSVAPPLLPFPVSHTTQSRREKGKDISQVHRRLSQLYPVSGSRKAPPLALWTVHFNDAVLL